MRASTALVLALALALTGCIQNMTDLKDRLGAEEPVVPAAVDDTTPAVEPATSEEPPKVTKPPVARITIFGANGALVFKSTFQADDVADLVFVEEKTKLNLIASDSETLEPGATLTSFAWTLNAKPIEGARQATLETGEAGLYLVALVVTDSHGKTDSQTVKLAVAPKPIDIVTDLVTGPVAGAEGEGVPGEASFDLTLAAAGVPNAMITKVKFVAASPTTCDAILDVVGPDGTSLGAKDDAGPGSAETIETGALAEGAYSIRVAPFACAAPDGVPVSVTVTYLQMIEGLEHGDGHGGH